MERVLHITIATDIIAFLNREQHQFIIRPDRAENRGFGIRNMESISISRKIPAPPDRIYQVCLNSGEHGAFTGSGAQIDPRISGPFIAWDGYITGITIDLELNRRIVRSWCTSDFPRGRDNSRIEFLLKETRGGTIIILNHTGIPDTQGDEYSGGGEDFCFKPMAKYFSGH